MRSCHANFQPQAMRVVAAAARAGAAKLAADKSFTKTIEGMKINLDWGGAELVPALYPAQVRLTDAQTGAPVTDLEPYLGAWDTRSFSTRTNPIISIAPDGDSAVYSRSSRVARRRPRS